ncbi:MAG: Pseudogene of conserved hypothetical protein [Methanobrevibacter sp. CfCl-M3]
MGILSYFKNKAEENKVKKIEANNKINNMILNNANKFMVIKDKKGFNFKIDNVGLIETKSVRRSNYSGGSYRVTKRGSYRMGSTTSESFDVKKHVDNGKLVVTDKNISFVGNNKTRSLDVKKIIDVEYYSDGVMFSASNLKKPVTFFSNDAVVSKTIPILIAMIFDKDRAVNLINNVKSKIEANNESIQ